MPSVLHDRDDLEQPYKLFGYSDKGYCAAFSKDGIHFTPAVGNPVIPLLRFSAPSGRKTWFSDVAPVFRDTRAGKYVSHVKTYEVDGAGRVRRTWVTPRALISLVGVNHDGRRIETFELTGADELNRRFSTPKRGEIVLDVTIENAKVYSLEVT